MSYRTLLLGAFALSLSGIAAARAADLDPPFMGSQQLPEDKVEFGSGWYIRGDIGATRLPVISANAPNLLSNAQASTVFAGGGNPQIVNQNAAATGAATVGRGSNLGYTASLGGGYQVTPWFRADVTANFNEPIRGHSSRGDIFCQTGLVTPQILNPNGIAEGTTGNCTGTYGAKLSAYSVLVNGYIDIGTWYGVTPYLGAGAGMAFGHYQTTSTYVQANNAPYAVTYAGQGGMTSENFNRQASANYYNFAWALMGGVAIDVYDRAKLDIGYRYLNLGRIDGVSGTLTSQEVRAGVRYMID